MKVNGIDHSLPPNTTLLAFLKMQNYTETRIAVELNGKILSRKDYESIILKESDCIEIVQFVGGG